MKKDKDIVFTPNERLYLGFIEAIVDINLNNLLMIDGTRKIIDVFKLNKDKTDEKIGFTPYHAPVMERQYTKDIINSKAGEQPLKYFDKPIPDMETGKHAKLKANQLIVDFEKFRKNDVKNDIERFENIVKKMKQIDELENRLSCNKKKRKKGKFKK